MTFIQGEKWEMVQVEVDAGVGVDLFHYRSVPQSTAAAGLVLETLADVDATVAISIWVANRQVDVLPLAAPIWRRAPSDIYRRYQAIFPPIIVPSRADLQVRYEGSFGMHHLTAWLALTPLPPEERGITHGDWLPSAAGQRLQLLRERAALWRPDGYAL